MDGNILMVAAGFGLVNIGLLTKIYFMLGGHVEKIDRMHDRVKDIDGRVKKLEGVMI